jgi:hypothetical protein
MASHNQRAIVVVVPYFVSYAIKVFMRYPFTDRFDKKLRILSRGHKKVRFQLVRKVLLPSKYFERGLV